MKIDWNKIKKLLVSNASNHDRGYAIEMVLAIETRANNDAEYAAKADKWLSKGSTILLRDELCWPFKNFQFVKLSKIPCPFDNMWEAIDTVGIQARASA